MKGDTLAAAGNILRKLLRFIFDEIVWNGEKRGLTAHWLWCRYSRSGHVPSVRMNQKVWYSGENMM